MRAFLILSALSAALATPVVAAAQPGAPQSLLSAEPETAPPPARLAPLAADSAWTPRFAAAADQLAAALRSRDEARWAPLLGGPWLAAADRARIAQLLRGGDSPFRSALFAKTMPRHVILGWSAPASLTADERAAIEARTEAEALVCWSARGDDTGPWPRTAAEADNRPQRPYACARIAYSIRGDKPTWRAFIEPDRDGDLAIATDRRPPA